MDGLTTIAFSYAVDCRLLSVAVNSFKLRFDARSFGWNFVCSPAVLDDIGTAAELGVTKLRNLKSDEASRK